MYMYCYCSKGKFHLDYIFLVKQYIFFSFWGETSPKGNQPHPDFPKSLSSGRAQGYLLAGMCPLVMMHSTGRTSVSLPAGATWLIIIVNSDLCSPPQSLTELHLRTFSNKFHSRPRYNLSTNTSKMTRAVGLQLVLDVVRALSTQRVSWGPKRVLEPSQASCSLTLRSQCPGCSFLNSKGFPKPKEFKVGPNAKSKGNKIASNLCAFVYPMDLFLLPTYLYSFSPFVKVCSSKSHLWDTVNSY